MYETAGKLEELRKRLRESKWELQRETKLAEKRALEEKRRVEEIAYLKQHGKHVEAFLKNIPK